jgi:hypothetical protein
MQHQIESVRLRYINYDLYIISVPDTTSYVNFRASTPDTAKLGMLMYCNTEISTIIHNWFQYLIILHLYLY